MHRSPHDLHFQRVKTWHGYPYENLRVVVGIAVLVALAFVALELMTHVIIPFIGVLFLILTAAFSCWALLVKAKPQVDTTRSYLAVITEEAKRTSPDTNEDRQYKIIVGTYAALIVFYALATTTVVAYALDPTYQHMPLNYVGAATALCMVAYIFFMLKYFVVDLSKLKTDPWKASPISFRVFSRVTAVLGIVYPVLVFAVKFGVL